jgi:hypothetical protein
MNSSTLLTEIDLSTAPVISPEAFATDPTNITIQDINACLAFASENNVTIMGRGNYVLTESIALNSVRWIGGRFSGSGTIYLTDSTIENIDISGPHIEIKGGGCSLISNKIHEQTSTAALLIRDLQSTTRLNCVNNEFYNCNYAILQQGTGSYYLVSGAISFNSFHDTAGDAIELNVVNGHYEQGLTIEGNIIANIDGAGPNWGIGIGVSGITPYDVNAPDENYAANFTVKDNFISGCRQCIHMELCRDFSVTNNICYPDSSRSTGSGIISGACVTYGCKRFSVNGLTGEPVPPSSRFLVLDWGNNSGVYAGPPTFFTIKNVDSVSGNIEVSTSGGDGWENTTIVESIRCNALYWRGLPPVSVFRNIYCRSLDCIGRHSDGEGSGGGIYTRQSFTCTHWVDVLCLDEPAVNASVTKMYVDKLVETGNNFSVAMVSESGGHRGPLMTAPAEVYLLQDDNFPSGREFSQGSQLWKLNGGYYRVTKSGASITGTELIQSVAVGQTYIQTANYDWSQTGHLKNAGTRLIIPGAGANGNDLLTTITNGTYVRDGRYTLDIEPAIDTAVAGTIAIHAAYPVEYSEINQ